MDKCQVMNTDGKNKEYLILGMIKITEKVYLDPICVIEMDRIYLNNMGNQ